MAGDYIVYFVRAGRAEDRGELDLLPVKVGWCQDLKRRLHNLQQGSPDVIDCLGLFRHPTKEAAIVEERRIHEALAPWRIRNEWFRPPKEELERMMAGAEPPDPSVGPRRAMDAHALTRRLRALGWTQRKAARVLNVSDAFVSRMASGAAPVPQSVADALGAAADAVLVVRDG